MQIDSVLGQKGSGRSASRVFCYMNLKDRCDGLHTRPRDICSTLRVVDLDFFFFFLKTLDF